MGWKTLDVGQQAIIYKRKGQATVIDGPQRLYIWPGQKYLPLTRYTANQSEYLVVTHKNGTLEHIPGPCAMFLNQLEHEHIHVEKGLPLDANEVLVVYRREDDKVVRYLQHGPTMFMLQSNEWIHNFSWHGSEGPDVVNLTDQYTKEEIGKRNHPDDPDNKFRKVPGARNFTKLRIIPDQFYYNVEDVRTKDEALIRVKLMLFYELKDIEKMLANTQDPIADFINGLCADVVSFASQLSYEEFMDQAEKLNDCDSTYPHLMDIAKKIGYNVSKVVFRGYHASSQLTKMHELAIKTRTKLRIEMEEEEQKQGLIDMKLKSELERSELEQSLHIEQEQHRLQLRKQQEEHELTMKSKEKVEKIRHMRRDKEAVLMNKKKDDEQMLNYLEKLHTMNVDLTDYLVSQNPQPNNVVRVISTDRNAGTVHIHQNTTQ